MTTNRPPLKIKSCPKCGSTRLHVSFDEQLIDSYVDGQFHDTECTQSFELFNGLWCDDCTKKITGKYEEAFDNADPPTQRERLCAAHGDAACSECAGPRCIGCGHFKSDGHSEDCGHIDCAPEMEDEHCFID